MKIDLEEILRVVFWIGAVVTILMAVWIVTGHSPSFGHFLTAAFFTLMVQVGRSEAGWRKGVHEVEKSTMRSFGKVKDDMHRIELKVEKGFAGVKEDIHKMETKVGKDVHRLETKVGKDIHRLETKVGEDIHKLELKTERNAHKVDVNFSELKTDMRWLKERFKNARPA